MHTRTMKVCISRGLRLKRTNDEEEGGDFGDRNRRSTLFVLLAAIKARYYFGLVLESDYRGGYLHIIVPV